MTNKTLRSIITRILIQYRHDFIKRNVTSRLYVDDMMDMIKQHKDEHCTCGYTFRQTFNPKIKDHEK